MISKKPRKKRIFSYIFRQKWNEHKIINSIWTERDANRNPVGWWYQSGGWIHDDKKKSEDNVEKKTKSLSDPNNGRKTFT